MDGPIGSLAGLGTVRSIGIGTPRTLLVISKAFLLFVASGTRPKLSRGVWIRTHFHTLACKGQSLEDVLIESGIVASGSVAGVLQGKHYNRAIRTHKVTINFYQYYQVIYIYIKTFCVAIF